MSSRGGDRGRGRGRGTGGFGGSSRGGGDRGGRGGPAVGGFRGSFRGGGGGGGPSGPAGGVYAPPGRQANIDSRLLDKSQDEIVSRLKAVKIGETEMPLRPDFGTTGRAVKLRTNYFPIQVPKGPFYEYDVSISPSASIKRVKRRIFQLAEQTRDWKASLAGFVAHDHSAKLVACKKLPQPLTVRVPFYDEDEDGPAAGGREYTLSINYIQELETESLQRFLSGDPQYRNYDIMPIVSALNLILAAFPNRSGGGGVMVGRNKFFIPTGGPSLSLGGGLEAVRGFYSSVRTSHKQLLVNVNVCTTAFYKPGNLAIALQDFMNMSFNARPNAFVKGLRVKAIHLGYRKTIKKIANVTAKTHSFDSGEYGRVTVEQYFRRRYGIKLEYPDLALVDVGGQKANFLPPELCEILPNQAFRGKLLDEHTASMITYAARPPNANASAIENQGLSELGFKQDAPPLGAFGVGIGKEMAVVPGRILPSPRIQYGQGTPQVDDRASWNLKDVRFAKGAKLDNWAVLLIRDGSRDEFQSTTDPELLQVLRGFMSMCSKSGMFVGKDLPPVTEAMLPPKNREDPIRGKAIGAIKDTLTTKLRKKPILVLVILSNGDKHIYSGLKHLCDVYLDVATVCVHAAKIRKEKGQLQYFANVALKFNMKLGGINHSLDKASMTWLNDKPTMLVGIDVTHPGFGSVKGTPSIAAVVASVDQSYAQYPASMQIQESKKEMVTNLEKMMVERLTLYKTKSKMLPDRILVYRDGVSEGQFSIVVAEEMPAMIAAFKRFNTPQKPYRPKLTIVICGKRHHTRFYPTESENADRNGNPKAGTVVDRGVTSVYNFDFFLQAHGGLQGTTKPTHYYVVHDEIGFNADKLQTLTNAVSYMFARATKAVSLVSPAYYADLACERGRCYLHKLLNGLSSSASTAASGADEEQVYQEAANVWRNGVAGQNLKDTMFYL